jgi:hypothetical protein
LRRKKGSRVGTLLFLIPIILVVAVLAYAVVTSSASPTGALIIEGESSDRYYSAQSLNVLVTVKAQTGTTPWTISLAAGYYNVTYSNQPWYATPASRLVAVLAGKTSYAVGVYNPVVRVVSVAGGVFNTTEITAKHGVTPVVWVNRSGDDQFISSQLTGRVEILPMQNYTHVFQQPGTFAFSFPHGGSSTLLVSVS